MSVSPADSGTSLGRLLRAYAAVMALLALTYGLSLVDTGRFATALALGIAVTKAVLVLAVFMELAESSSLLVITAAAGFYWLAIMMTLAFTDYATR
jgi:cytochrome c oxidase subunit 4